MTDASTRPSQSRSHRTAVPSFGDRHATNIALIVAAGIAALVSYQLGWFAAQTAVLKERIAESTRVQECTAIARALKDPLLGQALSLSREDVLRCMNEIDS